MGQKGYLEEGGRFHAQEKGFSTNVPHDCYMSDRGKLLKAYEHKEQQEGFGSKLWKKDIVGKRGFSH